MEDITYTEYFWAISDYLFYFIALVGVLSLYFYFASSNEGEISNVKKDDEENLPINLDSFERSKKISHSLEKLTEETSQDVKLVVGGDTYLNSIMGLIRKDYESTEFRINENEVGLSEKEYHFLINSFENTNYAWMGPMAIAITDDGKLRIPFSVIQFLINDFSPVMLPDGTMKVMNFLSLDESVTLSLMKNIPMFVRDGEAIRTFTPEMLKDMMINKDMDEILSDINKLEEYSSELVAKEDSIKQLTEKLVQIVSKLKETNSKNEKLSNENEKLKRTKEQQSSNGAADQAGKIKTLSDQIERLQKNNDRLNSELINEKKKNLNNTQAPKKNENNRNSSSNHNSNKKNTIAIPRETKDEDNNSSKVIVSDDAQKNNPVEGSGNRNTKLCTKKFLLKTIEEMYLQDNRSLEGIGLRFVANKYNSEGEKIFLFVLSKFSIFVKEWEKKNKCMNNLQLESSVYYLFNNDSEKAIKINAFSLFTNNKNIVSNTDDYLFTEEDSYKKNTPEEVFLAELIFRDKIIEVAE